MSKHSKWVSDSKHVPRNSNLVGDMELLCQGTVNGSVTQGFVSRNDKVDQGHGTSVKVQ